MSWYSLGLATVAPATGAPYMSIHTGANYRAQIVEIGLACNAATASSIGLIRPSNTPVATTSTLGLAENPADPASTVNMDTAWSTVPTIGTSFLRRFGLPATVGAGVIWTWSQDKPLVIPVSSWLILWNFGGSTASVLQSYIKWLE
jgi:hypothetical protein